MSVTGILSSEHRRRRLAKDDDGGPVGPPPSTETMLAIAHKNTFGYGLTIFGLFSGLELLGRLPYTKEITNIKFANNHNWLAVSVGVDQLVNIFEVTKSGIGMLYEFVFPETVTGFLFDTFDSKLVVFGANRFIVYALGVRVTLLKEVLLGSINGKSAAWRNNGKEIAISTNYSAGNYLHIYNTVTWAKVTIDVLPFPSKAVVYIERGDKLLVSYINDTPYLTLLDAKNNYAAIPTNWDPLPNYPTDIKEVAGGLVLALNASPPINLLSLPDGQLTENEIFNEGQLLAIDPLTAAIAVYSAGGYKVDVARNTVNGLVRKVHAVSGQINAIALSPIPWTVDPIADLITNTILPGFVKPTTV